MGSMGARLGSMSPWDCNGLEWNHGVEWSGVDLSGVCMMMECNAVECNGMDRWNAMQWSGMQWMHFGHFGSF